MAHLQPQRNFLSLQADFENDTGLKVKDNMAIYISYCQLRYTEGLKDSLVVVGNHLASVIRENRR